MGKNPYLLEIEKSLNNLEKTGLYDTSKYSHSLLHLTNQLEYFYCNLVPKGTGNSATTIYKPINRPKEHQLAYFNLGRGFPKELMDGHWCYVVKDLGSKMFVIPCTSIKADSKPCNLNFEFDIEGVDEQGTFKCRIQLSDIRSIDVQRVHVLKKPKEVVTGRDIILEFVKTGLIK